MDDIRITFLLARWYLALSLKSLLVTSGSNTLGLEGTLRKQALSSYFEPFSWEENVPVQW